MVYNIAFPPDYTGGIRTFKAHFANFPEYNLFSIDKESYVIKGLVENSDEGHSQNGRMIHNLQIGHYCSIAEDVYFLIGRGKNYKRVSTSNAKVLHTAPSVKKNHREKGSIIIENDVWIGRKVSIMSGVTVHNGAIIAANSHVVKDVPPYAIVGGNPARIIGYRFAQEIIDQLQIIQWWYWSDDKIQENAAYFNDDIETFCKKFYLEAKENFEKKYGEPVEPERDKYFMAVDYNDHYSVLESVLDEFICNYYNDSQKEIVLFVFSEEAGERYLEELTGIINDITAESHMKASIHVKGGGMSEAKECLASANHLIINRMPCTVELMCFAEMFGGKIEVLSGVDSIIFAENADERRKE